MPKATFTIQDQPTSYARFYPIKEQSTTEGTTIAG
jgi:hypothetical protein